VLLFLGDSISNGNGATSIDRAYPQLVASELAERFANWSKGGRTSRDGFALREEALLQAMPDWLIVQFGTNDMKPVARRWRKLRRGREVAVPADEYVELTRKICQSGMRCCGARALVVSPPPIEPFRREYVDGLKLLGYPVAVARWRPGMVADDGAHPNDAGHAEIARAVVEAIRHAQRFRFKLDAAH
jgi:lysophospholipase L1-like esterase